MADVEFIKGTASVNNGSSTINISGANAQFINVGTAVFIDGAPTPVEAVSGTSTAITLRNPWPHADVSSVGFVAFNTLEGLASVINRLRSKITDATSLTLALSSVVTSTNPSEVISLSTGDVTITPYGYLSAQTEQLITDLQAKVTLASQLETDVDALEATVNSLQTSIDADLASAQASAAAASSSETNAAVSEANAASSATAAESSRQAAAQIFDQFGDQYLGSKTSDPTTDNDGDPLNSGDIYWNSTDNVLKFYTGSAWVAPENVATTAANQAQSSASASATSESNASDSETQAANSASAASLSETNAAASEQNVINLYDSFDDRYLGGKTSDPITDNDGDALQAGALYFNTSDATLRFYSGTDWKSPENIALTAASNAETSATQAGVHETNAANSASAASASELEASNSASAASNSASAAAMSETNASDSELAAGTSESNAASSELAASNSASNALASEQAASTSETNAAASETAAATSETNAAASEQAAATSETNAASSETLAQKWATENEDIAVTTGLFSSKHWAFKSAASAAEAQQAVQSVTGSMYFAGLFDASIGTYPSPPAQGSAFYKVSVAGTVSGTPYAVGDSLIYDNINSQWLKLDGTDQVASVNGQIGTVVLDSDDINEGASNQYFTSARAISAIKGDISWNASDWDTAFSWGDHSLAGYAMDSAISTVGKSGQWADILGKPATATRWPAWAEVTNKPTTVSSFTNDAGYLTSESDPTVPPHVKNITTTNISNWNTAYGWGDHAQAGYFSSSSGKADTATAQAGTNDTQWMSPLKTKESIASDVNIVRQQAKQKLKDNAVLYYDFRNDEGFEHDDLAVTRGKATDLITYTCSTTATGQTLDGRIVEVAPDTPRLVGADGESLGLLNEPSSENLQINSDAAAPNTKQDCTLSTIQAVRPDGLIGDVQEVTLASSFSFGYKLRYGAIAGGTIGEVTSGFIYARTDETPFDIVVDRNDRGYTTYTIGSRWTKCIAIDDVADNTFDFLDVEAPAGSEGKVFQVAFVQREAGYPTSYTPTGASTSVRGVSESLSPLTGKLSENTGTLFWSGIIPKQSDVAGVVSIGHNGTSTDSGLTLIQRGDETLDFILRTDGGTGPEMIATNIPFNVDGFNALAFTYDFNNNVSTLAVNGIEYAVEPTQPKPTLWSGSNMSILLGKYRRVNDLQAKIITSEIIYSGIILTQQEINTLTTLD